MLDKISRANIKYITQKPKMVLLIALIVTILASVVASNLAIELNWVALAPKGNEAVKEYSEILENFPSLSNIMVVVEGDNTRDMSEAVAALNTEITKLDDYVTSMTVGLDQDFVLKYGLLLDEDSKDILYLLKDPNFEVFLMALPFILEGDMPKAQLDYYYEKMDQLLKASQKDEVDQEAISQVIKDLYSGNTLLTSEDGKMTLLTIQPSFDMFDLKKLEPGIEALENAVERVSQAYPSIEIGVTGMHVVARDETVSIQSDSSLTTILALVLIFTLLYLAFRSVLAPVLAFIPLLLGIVWGVGLTTIIIGRLNMLTAFAAAMLLGLGVDYAIHLYSSYVERCDAGFDKINALSHAINITGPGIITGALTTAVAFFSLNISKLEMLRELGTVMGLGIICTLLAVFWILPALIMLQKKNIKISKMTRNYKWVGRISSGVNTHKSLVIVILLVSTLFMANQARHVSFDMNLLNLEPEGLKSIEVMEHLIDEYDMSTDSFSISVDSLEEVYKYHHAFEQVEGVKEVVSIAGIIPSIESQEKIIKDLKEIDAYPTQAYRDIDESIVVEHLKPYMTVLETKHLQTINRIYYETLSNLGQRMLSFELLRPQDLPEAYKSQFISEDETKYLITVYPNFDIWENLDTDKGEKFFNDLHEINKKITGTPIFMKVIFDSAASELLLIGGILIVILLSILLLHFRSIKYALAALLPLILTLIFMLGIMSLLDLKFNMLNFLSILLIIGIGIDNGVHILHHYKIGERKIGYLFSSVGKAILLTTLTTVCGFGSLVFSSYRGIASLGAALSIGVVCAFVMTIVVLPLLLRNKA